MKARTIIAGLAMWCICSGGAPAQTYTYQTPIAPGVAVPNKIDSSIGKLNLSYGYPDDATA